MDQYLQQQPAAEYSTSIEKCISNYHDEIEGGGGEGEDNYSSSGSGGFECNICLDPVHDPVVTLCGHLYCWPCIYKWINFQTSATNSDEKMKPQCPVCKTNISERKLIPLYAKSQTSTKHPSSPKSAGIIIPRRPSSPPSFSSCILPNCQRQQQLQLHHPTLLQPELADFDGGRMIYERIFSNSYSNNNVGESSYRLAGSDSPRLRRHLVETDRSLGRLCFFIFCCIMFCLLLF